MLSAAFPFHNDQSREVSNAGRGAKKSCTSDFCASFGLLFCKKMFHFQIGKDADLYITTGLPSCACALVKIDRKYSWATKLEWLPLPPPLLLHQRPSRRFKTTKVESLKGRLLSLSFLTFSSGDLPFLHPLYSFLVWYTVIQFETVFLLLSLYMVLFAYLRCYWDSYIVVAGACHYCLRERILDNRLAWK